MEMVVRQAIETTLGLTLGNCPCGGAAAALARQRRLEMPDARETMPSNRRRAGVGPLRLRVFRSPMLGRLVSRPSAYPESLRCAGRSSYVKANETSGIPCSTTVYIKLVAQEVL